MKLPEWVAPIVIIGAVAFSAGLFSLCARFPQIGDWFADRIHRPKK